ncbi:hypothetical protein TNCV_1625371 [Trichonephila clavipes]|nr:hypothetical protein TNCV_1625371 [Trichonephila clavipes]
MSKELLNIVYPMWSRINRVEYAVLHVLNVREDHQLQHLRDVALAFQCTGYVYWKDTAGKSNTTPNHDIRCRISGTMHNATVQQFLSTLSPNSSPTSVLLQVEDGFISKHNVFPFRGQFSPFITPLAAQMSVVFSQG